MDTTNNRPTDQITDALVNRYNLDSRNYVRYTEEAGYLFDAISCYGVMPGSNETGWFYVGEESAEQFLRELEAY